MAVEDDDAPAAAAAANKARPPARNAIVSLLIAANTRTSSIRIMKLPGRRRQWRRNEFKIGRWGAHVRRQVPEKNICRAHPLI